MDISNFDNVADSNSLKPKTLNENNSLKPKQVGAILSLR